MTNEEIAVRLGSIRRHSEALIEIDTLDRTYILGDLQVRLYDLERELKGRQPRSWTYRFAYPMRGER